MARQVAPSPIVCEDEYNVWFLTIDVGLCTNFLQTHDRPEEEYQQYTKADLRIQSTAVVRFGIPIHIDLANEKG